MGSRIMHISIAKKVLTNFDLDENRFILGSIAPDAHLPSVDSKRISHFKLETTPRPVGRYLDYEGFLHKYQESIQDDFFLGYYCHLISDELWLFNIFNKYIKPFHKMKREEKLQLYYRDFRRLNNKLIQAYNLQFNIEYFEDFKIKEIDMNVYRKIIKELENDFNFEDKNLGDKLELLDINDIISFIEDSASKSIEKVRKVVNSY